MAPTAPVPCGNRLMFTASTLTMLILCSSAAAMDCAYLQGCLSCTNQQPKRSAPVLPGYKVLPPSASELAEPQPSSNPKSSAQLPRSIANREGTQLTAALRSASTLLSQTRNLLGNEGSAVTSAFLGQATKAEPQISGYSNGDGIRIAAQLGSSQGQAAANAGAAGPKLVSSATADANRNSQRTVHAAGLQAAAAGVYQGPSPVPLVLAPPALDAHMSGQVPLAYPAAQQAQQPLNVLTTDPKANGPHPWDVLLFKTNQFNTTKPAYRLGGLGLMLMADFNKSQPLTDWHAVGGQPQPAQPQAQQQQQVDVRPMGSTVGSGQAQGVFGQLGQMVKQAVQGSSKSASAIRLESGQVSKPPSLVEQLKSMLQKLNKPNSSTGAAGQKDAVFSIASVDGPARLWCTACQGPAYKLSEFGYCVCSPGYGRILDSKNPYACVACPAGHISTNSKVAPARQPAGPTEIRLAPPTNADLAPQPSLEISGSVLSVCQACPQGTVANQQQTACVAP